MGVREFVDARASVIARQTESFVETAPGQWFLSLALLGPIIFLPTVWNAWTAENIDALRTFTWPMLTVVNLSVFLATCHNGDWRMRLCMATWVVLAGLVALATFVR